MMPPLLGLRGKRRGEVLWSSSTSGFLGGVRTFRGRSGDLGVSLLVRLKPSATAAS
jgi:hypothetical protein